MINIVDYVQLCSESLLCVIDNEHYCTDTSYIYLDFGNKKVKQLFRYYIQSQLKAKYYYGQYNMVINSCFPKDNWRQIDNLKYIVTDESIKIDICKFEQYTEWCFRDLQQCVKEFSFLQHKEVDFVDTVYIIQKVYGHTPTKRKMFSILDDGNNIVDHTIDIPRYIFQTVENSLLTLI